MPSAVRSSRHGINCHIHELFTLSLRCMHRLKLFLPRSIHILLVNIVSAVALYTHVLVDIVPVAALCTLSDSILSLLWSAMYTISFWYEKTTLLDK